MKRQLFKYFQGFDMAVPIWRDFFFFFSKRFQMAFCNGKKSDDLRKRRMLEKETKKKSLLAREIKTKQNTHTHTQSLTNYF